MPAGSGTRTQTRGRSLASYLILPRPGDLGKAWIVPLGFLIGAVAAGGAGPGDIARGLIVWFALEGLIYPARYQWNDIRGYADDLRHPDAAKRGRLPARTPYGPSPVHTSAFTAVARLGLVGGLALAAAPILSPLTLVILAAAVFGVAAVYEFAKSRIASGSERIPPPLTAAIAGLWVLVGAGYAVRALAGLAVVIPILDESLLGASVALAAWLLGIAFVTSRWAVEALPFATVEDGKLSWPPGPAQGREHTLALARWLPDPGAPVDLNAWRPHLAGTPPRAPWNLSFALSILCAGLAGAALAGYADSDRIWVAALPILVALLVRARFVRASVNSILGVEIDEPSQRGGRIGSPRGLGA